MLMHFSDSLMDPFDHHTFVADIRMPVLAAAAAMNCLPRVLAVALKP
jgi:hypothetical protein